MGLRHAADSVSRSEITGAVSKSARTPTAALPAVNSVVRRALSASLSPRLFWWRLSCRRAADEADTESRRAQQQQNAANRGLLAGAPCAHLVLLELTVGIENQDPDGVAFGDPRVLGGPCDVVTQSSGKTASAQEFM